ncbi:unnamed protein product [Pleuronectes platessa]|uniref:Uncharacterized protein n=1 Tax=Pleuronectes platessa TaxID=8262 RepID=A0A9N7TKI4_PLEPL|nr:unnamed protein product [Pleuronectes platessa]
MGRRRMEHVGGREDRKERGGGVWQMGRERDAGRRRRDEKSDERSETESTPLGSPMERERGFGLSVFLLTLLEPITSAVPDEGCHFQPRPPTPLLKPRVYRGEEPAPNPARPPTLANLCIFAVGRVASIQPLSRCALGVSLPAAREQNRLSVKLPMQLSITPRNLSLCFLQEEH